MSLATRLACWSFALITLPGSPAEAVDVGDVFPALDTGALQGKLPELAPARVIIVDFWASWCGPCKQSFPVYEELHRKYAERGLVVVAINVDRQARDMERFLARHPVSFAIVRDDSQELVAQVAPPAMPTAFVLDHKRQVRFRHDGFHGERSRQEYIEQIETLLSESP